MGKWQLCGISGPSPFSLPSASSGKAECLSVALVPTQLRKYGLWNSSVQGNAVALLFLWVSDAELELLKGDLSALQPAETLGGVVAQDPVGVGFSSVLSPV